MKRVSFNLIVVAIAALTTAELSSCKGKAGKDTTNKTADTTSSTTVAPVEVSSDEALRSGVKDATKDYPTVTATVENGVVTLTGTLERSKLQDLMQSIHNLKPKDVKQQLTLI
jgi:osmotically-inducible protein OsmY